MVSTSQVPESRGGYLTLEAIIGSTLLMVLLLGLLHIGAGLKRQHRLETSASLLVLQAARQSQPAGASRELSMFDGLGKAELRWGDDYVWVRVEAAKGRVAAERIYPRVEP